MPDVAFKDLCIDATRPEVVGEFWSCLLGLSMEVQANGDAALAGPTPQHRIWVNGVPEPQDVKNRVHLDVRVEDPTAVPGTTAVSEPTPSTPWRVVADPDGLQLCLFGPRDGAALGPFELVVDAVDPHAIAGWWAERLGVEVQGQEGKPWVWLEGVPGLPWDYWVFNPVPEPKTAKNRAHWDVTLVDASVDDLVAVGASVLMLPDDEVRWTVMADPEGNEFCAFAPS